MNVMFSQHRNSLEVVDHHDNDSPINILDGGPETDRHLIVEIKQYQIIGEFVVHDSGKHLENGFLILTGILQGQPFIMVWNRTF